MKLKGKVKTAMAMGIRIPLLPKMAKFLKKKKKKSYRFKLPFSLECKGCHSSIAMGVEVNVIRELKGKQHIRKVECPCCGHQIVMGRTNGGKKYDVIKGAVRKEEKQKTRGDGGYDWNEWKRERSKAYLDGISPGLSERYNIFDIFQFAMVVGDPRGDEPLRGV